MKTVKPQKLGVLLRSFENGDACYFAVSVLVFFPFAPPSAPLADVDMWKFAAAELGDEPLDMGMPKQRGEVLVTGSAYPVSGPRPVCAPRIAVGAVDKTLYVVGDRFWKGGAASDPQPFGEMPITYERAFGGEGYALNPLGKGFAPVRTEHGEIHLLPNVEDPKHLVRSPADRPAPAGLAPYDFTWPQRFSKVGTYDAAWLKERFPGFAKDLDWAIWNAAPADQQIAGHFVGDEPFTIEYMHPEKARIEGRLPGVRARAFVTQKTSVGEVFREIQTRLDTIRFFPHRERGVLIFHGMIEVAEDDGADVLHLVLGCEDLGAPKPVPHYRDVLDQRLDKRKGAFFALRDHDLMPAACERGDAPADDVSEMGELVATEGLLRKNLRRKIEADRERARQHMISLGMDPGELPPLPPDEPPSLEDLPAILEQKEAEAEQIKAEAQKRRAELEQQARELCAARGVDYELFMREAGGGGGPPKFSATQELGRLREAFQRMKAAGASDPELEAALSDPSFEGKLHRREEQLLEGYRKTAHLQPAAPSLAGDEAARLRREVLDGRRAGRSFAGCDLTGADLSGLDLTKVDFKGALLEGADLSGSELGGADFTDAVLCRANLAKANLFAAKLAGANAGGARLVEAQLGSVDLTGAVLTKADLTGAQLRDAKLSRVDLSEAILSGADFTRVEAPEVNFIKTDLTGVKLGGADMSKCNFIESTVAGVDFTGAKLVSAVFVTSKGDRAVFRDADLTNLRVVKDSSFERVDFKGAKLDGANLRGTRLAGSDLSGAHLDGADLSECDLRGARFYRASARGAQLIRADLTGAVMTSINLMEGSLQKAIIAGADLRGANLFRVDFAKTRADASTNLKDANVKHVRVVPPRRGPNAAR